MRPPAAPSARRTLLLTALLAVVATTTRAQPGTSCLPRNASAPVVADAAAFVAALGARRLMLMGDSTMNAFRISMRCWAGAVRFKSVEHKNLISALHFKSGTCPNQRACGVDWECCMRGLLDDNSTQVAVVNIGVHYHEWQAAAWDEQIVQLLAVMAEWQAAGANRTAVYLESVAQHFEPDGHYSRPRRGAARRNVVNGSCVCGMPSEAAQTNWVAKQNRQARAEAARRGVRVLPIYELTLAMPTWHRGHGLLCDPANCECDCTHYRVNGEIMSGFFRGLTRAISTSTPAAINETSASPVGVDGARSASGARY